ncbi:MAG: hypothetical protein ACT6Q8_17640 [Niveispirillum sp.]|uniref:hypothetical protein n=1 Tax=Niveispirillum sp. TaxID=1917217 RepID=UPI0012E2BC23
MDLADDLLCLLRALPQETALWRRLAGMARSQPAEDRARIAEAMAGIPADDKRSRWLQYSALLDIVRDESWMHRLASLVDDDTPTDIAMGFVNLAYAHALMAAANHEDLRAWLAVAQTDRVIAMLADRLKGVVPHPIRAGQQPLKVALYTPQIVSDRHAATSMGLSLMAMLSDLGHDARFYSAMEMSIPFQDFFFGASEIQRDPGLEADSLRLRHGKGMLHLGNRQRSLAYRLSAIGQAIDRFGPDLVLFIGYHSPLGSRLAACYPMLAMATHAMPPALPVDAWLSAQMECETADGAVPFPYRFWPSGSGTAFARASLSIPDTAPVMVTAGVRLRQEMPPAWCRRMLALLDDHSTAHWLVVGAKNDHAKPDFPAHPRVHFIPYSNQLAELQAMADIYVNPPRLGGGASVAMAMERGLAVAALPDGDGGDKLGRLALPSEEAFFTTLAEWLRDPDARRRFGETLRQQFASRLDLSSAAAAQALEQALILSLRRGGDRLACAGGRHE